MTSLSVESQLKKNPRLALEFQFHPKVHLWTHFRNHEFYFLFYEPSYLSTNVTSKVKAIYSYTGGLETRDWKSQDWKTWYQIAGVEKMELENTGPKRMGENSESGDPQHRRAQLRSERRENGYGRRLT